MAVFFEVFDAANAIRESTAACTRDVNSPYGEFANAEVSKSASDGSRLLRLVTDDDIATARLFLSAIEPSR